MQNTRFTSLSRFLASAGLTLCLLAACLAVMAPAAQAATLTVNSTADVATNFGACGNSAQLTSSGSLREAVCAANNAGATSSTITVAAGTYTLTNGELAMGKVSGSNITLNGAGAGITTIQSNGSSRVFNLDSTLVGNVTSHISGVTITGGSDSVFGGGGIIAGSAARPTGTPLDVLTISNSTITGNHASGGSNTGGGIAFTGGNLTITNSTISNNTSNGAQGSGLWYRAEGTGPGEGLTISGTTFSGNSVTTSSVKVGGALEAEAVRGAQTTYSAPFNISNSQFVGNTVTGSGAGTPVGGAIWAPSGVLTVTECTFTGNSVSGGTSPAGGAIAATGATLNLHYNRFTGNIGATGQALMQSSGTVDATDNWWGCNNGPGTAGCDSVTGTNGFSPTISPRLVLTATASPATVVGPSATSTITATLTQNSVGSAIGATNLDAFAGLPVAFSNPLPSGATLTAASVNLASGSASTTYNSQNTSGPGHVLATLDNGTATASITVNRPPAIVSGNAVTFTVGTAGTFTVTTTGYPAPAITETGAVPAGMTFHDNGNGTATLSGNPTAGGVYSLSLTASNGVNPNGTQTLTINVNQAPAVTTNPADQTVNSGASVSFIAAASGFPTPTVQWQRSTNGGGAYTSIAGATSTTYTFTTASADNGNKYRAVFTNSSGSATTTAATLTVNIAPTVTTNPSNQSVNAGATATFTAAADGNPTPTVQWQLSTNNGSTYSNIAGATSTTFSFTATAGQNGNLYRAVFTNSAGSATTTAATLTVPTYTISGQVTFGGAALSGVTIALSGSSSATTSTNSSGTYSFSNLASGGGYTVTPSKTNYTFSPQSQTFNNLASNQTQGFSATSTATASGANGAILISEFRLQGPTPASPAAGNAQGQLDEFIELYNNSGANADLSGYSIDTSAGLTITLPAGAIVPAHGHYLVANSGGYSLSAYAAPDFSYSGFDLQAGTGLALLDASNKIVDAVGFTNTPAPYFEGTVLAPVNTPAQHSFTRKLKTGTPQDTGNNSSDFVLVATDGNQTLPSAQLGAPGPENLASPIQRDSQIVPSHTDPLICGSCEPNRVRIGSGNSGTLAIRRHFTNQTGATVTRLRFRVVDITTLGSTVDVAPQAQLKVVNSADEQATNGIVSVTVKGTTVEEAPMQPLGGGLNSSLTVALPAGGLGAGASLDVQWVMQVVQNGRFRFYVSVEALP